MKTLVEFTRTTLVGGVLVLLPLYLAVLLLAKTLSGVMGLLAPITTQIPATVALREVLAMVIVIALCFIAGLVVRTGPGLRAVNALQHSLLEKIPGYTIMRGILGRLSGREDETTFQPALVEIEDALSPGFIIEELDDGRYTVLVPSVPTPAAGSLFILPRERVHIVDVPFTQAVKVVSQWGAGAGAMARGISMSPR